MLSLSVASGRVIDPCPLSIFQAPLEVEASTRFKEILAGKSHQDLNIGTKYTGDFEWLSGF